MRRSILLAITVVLMGTTQATAQTFTVVNDAHVKMSALHRVERALSDQGKQLDRYWHTGTITFGPGGWLVYLERNYRKSGGALGAHYVTVTHVGNWTCDPTGSNCAGQDSTAVLQITPYIVIGGAQFGLNAWSSIFSHEALEAIVNPGGNALTGDEVCDPFDHHDYKVDGVYVSAFATPAYFDGAPGRKYVGS